MRISDWSSDVCSSDLEQALAVAAEAAIGPEVTSPERQVAIVVAARHLLDDFVVGLRQHYHQHTECQGHEQTPGSPAQESTGRLAEEDGGGGPRDQEKKLPPPGTGPQKQRV